VCKTFEKVYFVPGNHEYYSRYPKHVLEEHLRECEKETSNLIVLDRNTCDDFAPGYRILGCTLWSHISSAAQPVVEKCVNDYQKIHIEQGKLVTTDDVNEWHCQDVTWLKKELKRAQKDRVKAIVFTHHAPLQKGTSNPQFEKRKGPALYVNEAFRTDLSDLLIRYQPHAWAFGHTHWHCFFTHEDSGTLIASHPVGYPKENVNQHNVPWDGVLMLPL